MKLSNGTQKRLKVWTNDLVKKIQCKAKGESGKFLLLGAGGCQICSACAQIENKPCRFPNEAITSLEAYGISVNSLSEKSCLRYNNGENTVTYFGLILFMISN